MAHSDLQHITHELPQLSELEIRFFLAYVGLEPASTVPRSPADAYQIIKPDVKRWWAHRAGAATLARIRSKGAIPLLLEYRNLGINRALDLLDECARAETVKVIRHGGGVWDYLALPDHRIRLRAARLLLEVHGVLGPEAQVNISVDNRQTFADAIAAQTEVRELNPSGEDARHAEDAEFTEPGA